MREALPQETTPEYQEAMRLAATLGDYCRDHHIALCAGVCTYDHGFYIHTELAGDPLWVAVTHLHVAQYVQGAVDGTLKEDE